MSKYVCMCTVSEKTGHTHYASCLNSREIMHQHISGEVVDLIPPFLQFIYELDTERITEIGPHLREL